MTTGVPLTSGFLQKKPTTIMVLLSPYRNQAGMYNAPKLFRAFVD
jgi:hypothetical protein